MFRPSFHYFFLFVGSSPIWEKGGARNKSKPQGVKVSPMGGWLSTELFGHLVSEHRIDF